MNVVRLAAAALAASLAMTTTVSAVTVGPVTVEALADEGAVERGRFNLSNIIDTSLGTTGRLNRRDILSFGFSGGGVLNVRGYDLYVFEAVPRRETQLLSLSRRGLTITGSRVATVRNAPGATSRINIYGYDLSDLGLAVGNTLTGSLFLQDNGNSPEIAGIGAVKITPMPLPASALMLLAALGGLVTLRRRQRAA